MKFVPFSGFKQLTASMASVSTLDHEFLHTKWGLEGKNIAALDSLDFTWL